MSIERQKQIRIEREEELYPSIRSICYGIIQQFLFLRPSTEQLILKVYKAENKLCINISDEDKFEVEFRVTYTSPLQESVRRVYIQ